MPLAPSRPDRRMAAGASAGLAAVGLVAIGLLGGWGAAWGRPAGPSALGGGRAGAEASAPIDGGILRIALPRPSTLDPAAASGVLPGELAVADLLYDGLTAWDPVEEEVVPAIARSWEVDEAGTTWRFTIDPAARFADGSTVRPTDVAASLDRIAAAGPTSVAARSLRQVVGWEAVAAGEAGSLDGVAVDGGAVTIRLDRPEGSLPAVLASPLLGIAPEGATARSLGARADGSGPFRPVVGGGDDLLDDAVIGLERVPHGRAHLDGVDLVLTDDPAAVVAAGDAEVAFLPWGGEPVAGESAAPFAAVLHYGFDLTDPVFADVRFREAIVAAVDRVAVAEEVYGGALDPRTSLIPAGLGVAVPACRPACGHDPALARRLVAEAFPGGDVPELVIDVDAGVQEEVARLLAADLRAAGISVVVDAHDPTAYPAVVEGGGAHLFRAGWTSPAPAIASHLVPVLGAGGSIGATTDVGAALDAAEQLPASSEDARWRAVERAARAEVVVLPIGQHRSRSVVGDRVHGLRLSVLGTFDAEAVWLAKAP